MFKTKWVMKSVWSRYFIFISRNRTTIKLLHAENGGLVLYMKRLEEGNLE